jgi:hypothetical protein
LTFIYNKMTRVNTNFNSSEVYQNILTGTNESNLSDFNPYANITETKQISLTFTDPYISIRSDSQQLPIFNDPYASTTNNNKQLPPLTNLYQITTNNPTLPKFTDPYGSFTGDKQRLPIFDNPYASTTNNNRQLPPLLNPYKTTTNNSSLPKFTDPYGSFTGGNVNSDQFGKSIDPFSSLFTSQGQNQGQNQSYLDQYATVKPSDYQVSQIDLDETKTNIANTPISSLNNKNLVSYYKTVTGSSSYKETLAQAEAKIKNKTFDSSLSQLGFFRDYLYNIELQNSIFDTKLSSGQRRHNYELLNQALNSNLKTKDAENPLNIEMEKYIIPDMMRLMAKDGVKVMIQEGSKQTAYSGNKAEASQEFIFQMDNMNWRTQIGDETFTKYAKLAINNAQDPNSAHSYTRMYESDIVKQRKDFMTQLNTLKGKEPELVTALKASSRDDTQKTLINTNIGALEKILNNDLKYNNSGEALQKVNDTLGDKNAINSLVLFLVTTPIEITSTNGSVIKIDPSNIFTKDTKTNTSYLDDDRVKEELLKRVQNLKTSL